MGAVDLVWVVDARGGQQLNKTFHRVFVEVGHAPDFVFHHKALHKVRILCGHARWAGIFVALQCLYASQCHHHGAGTVARIGTEGHGAHNVKAGKDFSGSNQFHFFANAKTPQRVIRESERI